MNRHCRSLLTAKAFIILSGSQLVAINVLGQAPGQCKSLPPYRLFERWNIKPLICLFLLINIIFIFVFRLKSAMLLQGSR
jgi:hypothetical protein